MNNHCLRDRFLLDLLFVRHAKSLFNQGQDQFYKKHPHTQWQQAETDSKYCHQVLFAPQFIDCSLSEFGKKQCLQMKDHLKYQEIDIVLVSPLRRALQTADILFGKRNIEILAVPELTEALRYSCDLSLPLSQKKCQFPKINFDLMPQTEKHWYSKFLQGNNKQSYHYWEQKHKNCTFDTQQLSLLQLIAKRQLYQSDDQINNRITKIKQILKQIKLTYPRIAIVSHYYIIQFMLSGNYKNNAKQNSPQQIINVWPYWTSLSTILIKKQAINDSL